MTNKVIKPIAVLLAAVILLSVLPLTASAAEAGQSVAEMSGTAETAKCPIITNT